MMYIHTVPVAPTDLPFVGSKELPFDSYEPLLSWVFERPEFRQWLLPNCKWQLRFIGGPGSGKTTLSALTVRHLREAFPDPNIRVVSIFFTRICSLEGPTLAYHLLEEILNQLSAPSSVESAHSKIEDLRYTLVVRLSQQERTFLVLDDVDLCSQAQWNVLASELACLQSHGVNVMITSRLSLWHEYSTAACDTGWSPEHGYLPTHLFWYCRCQNSIEEASIVCQSCKDAGYSCEEWYVMWSFVQDDSLLTQSPTSSDQTTNFVEPYDHVDLSLIIDNDIMSTYISSALELVHGDLGLSSSANPKPAHSKLGRALVASEGAATQLRDKIISNAEGNIAMAKLRLETLDCATTVEEVARYADRLPATIVSLFDTGIAHLQQRGPEVEDLGLKAIVGVVNEFHECPFADFERWLRKQMELETHAGAQSRDISVEDVLRAAGGFLTVDNGSDCIIGLYHEALGYYVAERYNEKLFWIHTSTNTVDADEFEKPRRMQTWHASRKDLRRADTWK